MSHALRAEFQAAILVAGVMMARGPGDHRKRGCIERHDQYERQNNLGCCQAFCDHRNENVPVSYESPTGNDRHIFMPSSAQLFSQPNFPACCGTVTFHKSIFTRLPSWYVATIGRSLLLSPRPHAQSRENSLLFSSSWPTTSQTRF